MDQKLLADIILTLIKFGYPTITVFLFVAPFLVFRFWLKKKTTLIILLISGVIGAILVYGWFWIGVLGLVYLQGVAVCDLYGC